MSIIHHFKTKSSCIYHFVIHHYLSSLYCNYNDKLRECVSNPRQLPYSHDKYEELRNWQIPDDSVIETDIPDNSNNDTISTDYLNGECSLEIG